MTNGQPQSCSSRFSVLGKVASNKHTSRFDVTFVDFCAMRASQSPLKPTVRKVVHYHAGWGHSPIRTLRKRRNTRIHLFRNTWSCTLFLRTSQNTVLQSAATKRRSDSRTPPTILPPSQNTHLQQPCHIPVALPHAVSPKTDKTRRGVSNTLQPTERRLYRGILLCFLGKTLAGLSRSS